MQHDDPAGLPVFDVSGYGFGVFVHDDLVIGQVVGHSGGYPGFGSHMRWHPASGIGVIALGNRTYAPMVRPCTDALTAFVTRKGAPVRTITRWKATDAARADVERLLEGWDADLADRLFAVNVDLDEPLEHRHGAIERIRERFGALTRDDGEPIESDSAGHLAWWMRGERGGRVRLEILLNAERPPRLQSLEIREVCDPSPALRAMAERVANLLSDEPPAAWPDDLRPPAREGGGVTADDEGRDAADRSLRVAAAMFGPVELGPPTDGDGTTTATFPLRGHRGTLTIALTVDPAGRLAPGAEAPSGPSNSTRRSAGIRGSHYVVLSRTTAAQRRWMAPIPLLTRSSDHLVKCVEGPIRKPPPLPEIRY